MGSPHPSFSRFDLPLSGSAEPFADGEAGRSPTKARFLILRSMRILGGLLLALALVSLPLATKAQLAGGAIPRLCFLTFDPGTLESSRFKPFFEHLRELHYVDGQTIA